MMLKHVLGKTMHSAPSTLNRSLFRSFASMEQIKELRGMSGAPIIDCKKALEAADTLEGAFEWLREHGLSKITAKAKIANEGLVALWHSPSSALLLEVRYFVYGVIC